MSQINFNTNEKIKRHNNFYPTEKCKYFVIPALIGFILLCILINVDFTNETSNFNINERAITESPSYIPMKCTPYQTNCSLYCSNGNTNYVDEDVQELQDRCISNDLYLEMKQCEFPKNKMKNNFLAGFFRLSSMIIADCNLQTIEDGVFDKDSLKNLKQLHLINNMIKQLDERSFEGLLQLQEFSFIQYDTEFDGTQFLKPLTTTLKTGIIKIANSVHYAPNVWFHDLQFQMLEVLSLNETNIQNSLDETSFAALFGIKYLHLANCSLNYVTNDMFYDLYKSLLLLNLSNNFLKTLDFEFLNNISASMQIFLEGNEWSCDCSNTHMMTSLAVVNADVKCITPSQWLGIPMMNISELDCTTGTESTPITDGITTTTKTSTPPTTTSTPPPPTTTSTPPPPTTTTTTNTTPTTSITLNCKSENNLEYFGKDIQEPKLYFDMRIILDNDTPKLLIYTSTKAYNFSVLYFDNSLYHTIINGNESTIKYGSESTEVTLETLKSNKEYLFCLLFDNITEISPFDCRAGYIALANNAKHWLFPRDKLWFISVNIVGIILCVILGILAAVAVFNSQDNGNNKIMLLVQRIFARRETKDFSSNNSKDKFGSQESYYLVGDEFKLHQMNCYNSSPTSSTLYEAQHHIPLENAPTFELVHMAPDKSPSIFRNLKNDTLSCQCRKNNQNNIEYNYEELDFHIYQTIDS